MNFKSGKYWVIASVLALVLVASFLALKKFRTAPSPSPPLQTADSAEQVPERIFVEAVPILFKTDIYREVRMSDADAFSPRVSPNGSWIAFIKRKKGKNYLSVVNLRANSADTILLGLDDYADPSWSADGKKIVFAGEKHGISDIYIYNLTDGKLNKVTNDPRRKKSRPRFSPYPFDGNYRIAYASEENGRKDIWWVRESGEFDQPITVAAERAGEFKKTPYWTQTDLSPPDFVGKGGDSPEWSPSGDMIIYRTGANSYGALIYGYQQWWREGKISFPSAPGLLSWSPNQMNFLGFDPASGGSFVFSMDDMKKKAVLAGRRLTSAPAWFPDGRGFAFTYLRDGRSVLAVEPYDDPLGDVANLWMYSYDGSRRDRLARNQLIFLDAKYDHIYTLYDSEMYADEDNVHAKPNLVTSDAVLETFYAAFSALLGYTERSDFAPALKNFAVNGVEVARQKKAGGDVEKFFLTGLALIDPVAAKSMPRSVRKEVEMIESAEGNGKSLFGKEVSYADFFIRGKYERDKDLQSYFRALKWFQNFTFDLDKEEDRRYVAGILQITTAPEVYRPLARINTALKEIIGESRYYGPLTLEKLSTGGELPAVRSALPWLELKNNFKLFPSIYTLDAHIFDELVTHRGVPDTVGTLENPRMLPLGMDIMAAFGSDEAREILLGELGEDRFANYRNKLDELKAKISGYPAKTWDENIYQNWLGTLATLVRPPGEKSPAFTRTGAWKRKELNTALGSWVNLRYETIAYVEQISAEGGEGGYERIDAGLPRGYVEPNPEFFHRLDKGFARISRQFSLSISDPELRKAVAVRIAEYRKHLQILERIARKELDNEPLTDAEYGEIHDIGATVEHFILIMNSMGGKEDEGALKEPDSIRKIVDVQQHPSGKSRLYEALGYVNEINVAVPYYGRREIVKGPVYSYYEFRSGEQLDSAKWRAMKPHPHPSWIEPFYAGKSGSKFQGRVVE